MTQSQDHKARALCRTLAALGLLSALLIIGCRPTLEEETAALLETDARFAATSLEVGMGEAFFRFMAPDGMLLRPGEGPVRGLQTIKDRMTGRTDILLSWSPQRAEVSASRDLGYTWGVYTVERTTPQGPARIGSGKYLNVWRKQPDGAWKVLIDIGNEDPSPGPAANEP